MAHKTMSKYITVTIIGVMMFWSAVAAADGRYQVAPLESGYDFGTEKAMILDTAAGHLWIWVESPADKGRAGGRYLIYQGQVLPGKEMGDIMSKQEWPADGAGE